MSTPSDRTPQDPPTDGGRPITLTPVPPGLWLVIGGLVVATLGPMFGFLLGTILGSTTQVGDLQPIYLFLFLGLLVGAVGIAMMLVGARRLYKKAGMTTVDVS